MIEPAFDNIYQRIQNIRKGMYSDRSFHFNYQEAILHFKLKSAHVDYKQMAEIIVSECIPILSEIYQNRKQILQSFKRYTDIEVIESGTIELIDEFGVTESVPNIYSKEKEILVDEIIRESFYKKFLEPELKAYKYFFETFGYSFENGRKVISIDIANRIASIEIGEKGVFIEPGTSTENFIELLTNTSLTEIEIKELKIKINVTAFAASYIFTKLFNSTFFNITTREFKNFKCFYNNETIITLPSIRTNYANFKAKLKRKNLIVTEIARDVDEVIAKIEEMV